MIWELYKHELNYYLKGGKALMLLFMVAILLFSELFLSQMSVDIYSLSMGGTGLIYYVFISQIFSDSQSIRLGQPNTMEYYLAKPISRNDLFWAKLLNVITICFTIMTIVILGHLMKSGSHSTKFNIRGYENVVNISKIESFKTVYNGLDNKQHSENQNEKIRTFLDNGQYSKANKEKRYYSRTFLVDDGLIYVLFLKFFLLLWSVISAIFYINIGDTTSIGEYYLKYLKNPIGYLKLSGWILILAIALSPMFMDDMSMGVASQFVYYLLHFKILLICSPILLLGLILTLRKNYLNISI